MLPRLSDGAYDLVFCDADQPSYPEYLMAGLRLLRSGGIVVFNDALPDGDGPGADGGTAPPGPGPDLPGPDLPGPDGSGPGVAWDMAADDPGAR